MIANPVNPAPEDQSEKGKRLHVFEETTMIATEPFFFLFVVI